MRHDRIRFMKSGFEKIAEPNVSVVDLFCGAGGLAYGLKKAGLTIAAGVDLDPACEHPFTANCGGVFDRRSVADLTKEDLGRWFAGANVRVLAGCAPCQPFSTYSQSRKSPDGRWELLRSFLRLALETRPEIVTMENVRGLAARPVWHEFVEALEAAGYEVVWEQLRCQDYGVAQTRKRLVLIASLVGRVSIPRKIADLPVASVRSAIGDLPMLAAGDTDALDPLHCASRLSARNLARIKLSRPGGSWRDWPKDVRNACHTRSTGETYPSVYGRMAWDDPAPTITTQCFGFGNGRFGHPEQDRAISLREAALLQSFPKEYSFVGEGGRLTFSKVGKLIGNAVPPKLGEAIGRAILERLAEREGTTVP